MKQKNFAKKFGLACVPVLASALLMTAALPSFAPMSANAAAVEPVSRYTPAYESKEESKLAGLKLNERICQEGMVLLKNQNNALPIAMGKGTNAPKVSLFGYASTHPSGGGSADDGDSSAGVVRLSSDIYSSMTDAGFLVNPVTKAFYNNTGDLKSDKDLAASFRTRSGEADFKASLNSYSDAAVVVLGAPKTKRINWIVYNNDSTRHKQQYDEEQYELIDYVTAHFDKVIVLINNVAPVEIAAIQDNPKVDSILLISEAGDNGLNAVGQILSGAVNPSGRLPDIYPVDLTKDPVYKNSHNGLSIMGQLRYVTEEYDTTKNELEGNYDLDPTHQRNTYLCDYEEGIYNGYRFYETVAAENAYKTLAQGAGEAGKNAYGETPLTDEQFTQKADPANATDEYYNRYNGVLYPFGYGLSYSKFNQVIANEADFTNRTITSAEEKIQVQVDVTNTAGPAGKEVVQLYYTSPYGTSTTIEKSAKVLGDFEKTDILQEGDTQTVTLTISARDMASYDWRGNVVEGGGYVLEAGEYTLSIQSDSHEVLDTVTVTVESNIVVDKSATTGYTVENQFDDVNNEIIEREEAGGYINLSRKNGFANLYQIKSLTPQDRVLTDEEYKAWNGTFANGTFEDTAADPWYVAEEDMPVYADAATRPEKAEITLSDMVGKSYDHPDWDKLVQQLTIEEMEEIVMGGGFMSIGVDYIGKPYAHDTDGPKGWSGTGVGGSNLNKFAVEPLIAATFNKELSYEMGVMIGEQGLWGNSDNTNGNDVYSYTGWYAPGMNTHRGQFDFRFGEYYSEDGYLAGMMAANLSLGLKSRGGYVFIKHFALHEDGGVSTTFVDPIGEAMGVEKPTTLFNGYRGGDKRESSMSLWCNEQAMREIYFKAYQIAVEDGHAEAAMTSLSRIGTDWQGASYALLTEVLRNEWGFHGMIVTDTANNGYRYMDPELMIRAGGNLVLGTVTADKFEDCRFRLENNASKVTALQKVVKEVLYVVAQSNAMQVPCGAKVIYDGANVEKAKLNTEYSVELGTAELNTRNEYATINYSVTEGKLPEGLTLTKTGTLAGTPTQAGVYEFTVSAIANGYETASVDYRLVVEDSTLSDLSNKIDELGTSVENLDTKVENLENKENSEKKDSGCGSSVSVGGIAGMLGMVLVTVGVATFVRRKRKN